MSDKVKKVIINSSGGAGHKEAAKKELIRIKEELKSEIEAELDRTLTQKDYDLYFDYHVDDYVIQIDVLKDRWLGISGEKGAKVWDYCQAKGLVWILEVLINQQGKSEAVYGIDFEQKLKKLLQDNPNIDEVVDVQPQCMANLVHAVAEQNKLLKNNNQIIYTKHFTDPPTPEAVHFLKAIAHISSADLQHVDINIFSQKPVVIQDDEPTEDDYVNEFQALCNKFRQPALPPLEICTLPSELSDNRQGKMTVSFNDGAVRPEFLFRRNGNANKDEVLTIKLNQYADDDQNYEYKTLRLLGLAGEMGKLETKQIDDDGNIFYQIAPGQNAELHSIMLGSAAASVPTLSYVEQKILEYNMRIRLKLIESSHQQYIFVFCNKDKDLFQQVALVAKNIKAKHPNLRIVPLGYQSAAMIAQLYATADDITIRGGGVSFAEVIAATKSGARVHCHAEVPYLQNAIMDIHKLIKTYIKKDFTQLRNLLMAWESGNAAHGKHFLAQKGVSCDITTIYNYLYTQLKNIASQTVYNPIDVDQEMSSILNCVNRLLTHRLDSEFIKSKQGRALLLGWMGGFGVSAMPLMLGPIGVVTVLLYAAVTTPSMFATYQFSKKPDIAKIDTGGFDYLNVLKELNAKGNGMDKQLGVLKKALNPDPELASQPQREMSEDELRDIVHLNVLSTMLY